MMLKAMPLWRLLEMETGIGLMRTTGGLTTGIEPMVKAYTASLDKYSHSKEDLSTQELKKQFGKFISCWEGQRGVLDIEGGVLWADKCLHSFQSRFVKHGGILKDGEPVLEITPGDQTTVQTTKGMYKAKSVILCLGAWAGPFLKKLGLDLPLKPQLIKVCYWAPKNPTLAANQQTLYFEDGRHAFYGLPAIEYPGLYKFCLHSGPVISAESRDGEQEGEAEALSIVTAAVKAYLPGLEPKPAIVENCVYTWTPDAHPILDRNPFHPNIILGVGFSGHGFKLAPAVGEILSDLALGRTPAFDISLNTIKRFYKPRLSMQIMLP